MPHQSHGVGMSPLFRQHVVLEPARPPNENRYQWQVTSTRIRDFLWGAQFLFVEVRRFLLLRLWISRRSNTQKALLQRIFLSFNRNKSWAIGATHLPLIKVGNSPLNQGKVVEDFQLTWLLIKFKGQQLSDWYWTQNDHPAIIWTWALPQIQKRYIGPTYLLAGKVDMEGILCKEYVHIFPFSFKFCLNLFPLTFFIEQRESIS